MAYVKGPKKQFSAHSYCKIKQSAMGDFNHASVIDTTTLGMPNETDSCHYDRASSFQ